MCDFRRVCIAATLSLLDNVTVDVTVVHSFESLKYHSEDAYTFDPSAPQAGSNKVFSHLSNMLCREKCRSLPSTTMEVAIG